MDSLSTEHHRSSRARLLDGLVPLTVGALVVIVGVLIAESNNWGTGAIWTLGLVAALIASLGYAIPAMLRAPRLRDLRADGEQGAPQAQATNPASAALDVSSAESSDVGKRQPLTLGMSVRPGQDDAAGLAPSRVIVLSGHSASGKTRIAERLHADNPSWAWASCGAVVKAEAARRGGEMSPKETNELGQKLVEELGGERFLSEVLANATIPSGASTLIIDDVYHAEVFDAIKKRWQHLQFVTVGWPDSMRRQSSGIQDRQLGEVYPVGSNPLDAAVDELAAQHKPEIALERARTDDEIADRTRQIELAA
jgi:hypothetical protein